MTLNDGLHVVSLLHVSHLNVRRLDILPLFESRADCVPNHSVHGTIHEFPSQFQLSDVILPCGQTVFEIGIASGQFKPVASLGDVLASSGCFGLCAKLVEPISHSMLVFSLFQELHGLIKTLYFHCPILPFVKVVAQTLTIEHVSDALKLAHLHTTASHSLLLGDDFLLR